MKYVKTFEQYILEKISYVVGDVVVLRDGTVGKITKADGNIYAIRPEGANDDIVIDYNDIDAMYYANNTPADAMQNDIVKRQIKKISNDIMIHNYPNNPAFYGIGDLGGYGSKN